MIVSASRRTDLPGYYGTWLLNRLEAGYAVAVNPFNPRQRRRVPLGPEEVDAFVFWTRDPHRLTDLARRMRELGHERWVAHVTVTGLSREIEPGVPATDAAIAGTKRLAEEAGDARRVIWRFDPILVGPQDRPSEIEDRFARIARSLEGSVRRVVVSFLDLYRKTERRLREAGYPHDRIDEPSRKPTRRWLVRRLVQLAAEHRLELHVCAEPESYQDLGAAAARCVDPDLLSELFPPRCFPTRKDPGQRSHCGCAPSVDLGVPDTCPRGCVYCYATRSQRLAQERWLRHDPCSESLIHVARDGTSPQILRQEDGDRDRAHQHPNPRLPGL